MVLLIVSLAGFAFLVNSVFRLQDNGLDNAAFELLAPYITDGHTKIMGFFTFLGSSAFLLPVNILLTAYYLFFRKHKWYSITIPVVSLGAALANALLKLYFSRPRPLSPLLQDIQGFSFPSGHTMSAFAFYGLLIYLVWNEVGNARLKWLLITGLAALILLVGLSRVYFRVHYASDVLAGLAAGAIWVILSISALRKIEQGASRQINPDVVSKS